MDKMPFISAASLAPNSAVQARIPVVATRFSAAPRDAEFGSKPLKERVFDFQISRDFAMKLQIPLHFAGA
jgi:hypothetical protein